MNRSIKVLYVHGMESGVHGDKARYLARHFERVAVPTMHTGYLNFNQNSFLSHGLSNAFSVFSGRYVECITQSILTSRNNFFANALILLTPA